MIDREELIVRCYEAIISSPNIVNTWSLDSAPQLSIKCADNLLKAIKEDSEKDDDMTFYIQQYTSVTKRITDKNDGIIIGKCNAKGITDRDAASMINEIAHLDQSLFSKWKGTVVSEAGLLMVVLNPY